MQEIKHHFLQAEDAARAQEKRSQDIVSDMTRQYKSTQDELQQQHAMLETTKQKNFDEIERLKKKKEDVEKEMKDETQKLEEQINTLNDSISSMTTSFESMLKNTLDKMKLRIAEANEAWKEEQDSKLLDKFKEITENGAVQN